MSSDTTRRDFMNGAALSIAAALTPFDQLMAQAQRTGVYPPALQGLRGSTDASFKVIHSLAIEGQKFDIDTLVADETFDLVVVGAGLAGLTAAWAFHERRPHARILILDNNDDFGGHARRNETSIGGRQIVSYGGSESLVAPAAKFTGELDRILRTLQIAPNRFESEDVFHRTLYPGMKLSRSVFFNREAFGQDKLVTGDPLLLGYDEFAPNNPGARPVEAFLADCPLSAGGRAGLVEMFAGTRDYLGNMTAEQKIERLKKLSYRAFLTEVVKLPKDACDFFQGRPADNWGYGIDALGTIEMMGEGYPGAKALGLEEQTAGNAAEKAAYIHHFPDGNATIARALVRAMNPRVVKGTLPRSTMEGLIRAEFDYGRLDRAEERVRIRLEATVVRVRNAATGGGVDVAYVKDGKLRRVKAGQTVIATYASAMPHLCPEVPKASAELMRGNVKAPLVYTKVAVRSWESFVKLGTHKIAAPMGFHSTVKLDYPVSLGRYKFPRDPKGPGMLHLVHAPAEANTGLDARDQARAGRARLLGMTFADFEKHIRSDLDRMLRAGGFDAGRHIAGITVNRWSHGYSYTPSTLYDDVEALEEPQAAMKAKIGNIAFANSDTGWDAYAHTAMAEAVRAIGELTGEKPPPYRPRWQERFSQVVKRATDAAKAPDAKQSDAKPPETKAGAPKE